MPLSSDQYNPLIAEHIGPPHAPFYVYLLFDPTTGGSSTSAREPAIASDSTGPRRCFWPTMRPLMR
jgi:hypothetical protein